MKRVFAVLAVLMLVAVGCDNSPSIDSPTNGAIVDTATVPVTGHLPDAVELGGVLTVNGAVVAVASDRTWSTTLPRTPNSYTTSIHVEYTDPSGGYFEKRRSVVTGPKIDKGAFAPDGVGMKFTNTGLNQLGPMIQNLAGGAFDIGPMITSQDPLFKTKALTFTITGKGYDAGMGDIGITASSTAAGVKTHVLAKDIYVGVDMNINDGMLINMNCKLEINIPSTTIDSTFSMSPLASDPNKVDVNDIGQPVVNTGAVNYEFIEGDCDKDTVLGPLINGIAGPQIQSLVGSAFVSSLGDPDGVGPLDGPIAGAIQTALGGISIAGPVGEAMSATLDAPFNQIGTTDDGINFKSDARFSTNIGTGAGQCVPVAGAPTLPATYDVPGAYPTLGATAPNGSSYGLGLVIGASAFNQMLGSMTECGSLNSVITEIPLFGSNYPVTSSVLGFLVPAFASRLPADTPMRIVVTPNYAPFLTADAGPNGEPAELMLANLSIDFVDARPGANDGYSWLKLSVDAPLGFDLVYDAATSSLKPTITAPPADKVVARVETNAVGADEASVTSVFPGLFPSFIEPVASTFQAFPLPAFMGLGLDVAQVARQGNSFVLYANLDPQPQTRLANVTVTDQSDANSSLDGVFNVWEWRHLIRSRSTSTSADVDFKGMVGADACCTTSSASKSANAGFQVDLDVIPENGDTWHLDLRQFIKGAHTLIDEAKGSASTQIQTLQAKVSTDGGATWQSFNVDPSSRGIGSSASMNVGFSANKSIVISGTTQKHVIVRFATGVSANSNSSAIPAKSGDEAAVRFGVSDTISNGFTAGGYPGVGNRSLVDDGWFSRITLRTN